MFSSPRPSPSRRGNAAPRRSLRRRWLRSGALVLGISLGSGLDTLPLLAQSQGSMPRYQAAPSGAGVRRVQVSSRATPLDLRVLRGSDSVDVVISGVGSSPQLQQSRAGDAWLGRLFVGTPTLLRRGPQSLSLPELGIQSLTINGGGRQFDLRMTPVPGYPLGQPVVSADGTSLIISFAASPQASLQTYNRDLRMPGRVPEPDVVPPLQPRAVAPPVGDMAVGSILIGNSGYVNVSGPPISLRLARPVPARVVLMTLARNGGYGFVYVNDANTPGQQGSGSQATAAQERPVTVDFRNESYGRALNSVLLAAGLQGKLEGNTLMVGTNVLSKGFGAQLSKVYRLNQVSANSAADYLANLGATVTKTNTITTAVTQGISQTQAVATSPSSATTQSSTSTTVEAYGASTGPLVGLQATTDSRLSTITLVGDPRVVAVAETYLRQLDLRQRQVALSVKILDVTLDNDKTVDNSFAFRYGNNFIVNDSGQLLGAFGSLLPPNQNQFDAMANGVRTDPPQNPGMLYQKNFYNFLKATIESGSTKVLASPTLILSENSEELRSGDDQLAINTQAIGSNNNTSGGGNLATIGRTKANESFVTVGEQVITNYTVTTGTQGNGNSCQPQFGIAGLTFGARVQKIDDNGFVTFSMSPSITATVDRTDIQGCGLVDILAVRRLDSGSARVRDGQTLILTGVISDRDTQIVSKWPILGDIPLIGQFFRKSTGTRAKRELVIMVTPRIIDDNQGGTWGYGYQPGGSDARRFLGSGASQSPY